MFQSRWLLAGVLLSWIVLAAAALVLVWLVVTRFDTYQPITYYNPRQVLTPEVVQGSHVDLRVEWCNDDPNALISSSSVFQSDARGGLIVPRNTVIVDFEEGCHSTTVRITLPNTVTPGMWRIGGQDTAIASDGRSQRIAWFTGVFRVVPSGE